MTQLTDLISKCQDVEEKGETWTDEHKGCFATNASNRYEGFLAGAASQSPIADALREAIGYLEGFKFKDDGGYQMTMGSIRRILEGKE